MPRGIPNVYPDRFCEMCGAKIKGRQISMAIKTNGRPPRFCSTRCMNKHDKVSNPETIKEPEDYLEAKKIDRLIALRKEKLQEEIKEIVRLQTPSNDSPEAERRLRERICPNPPPFLYSSTGTANGL